MTPSSRVQRNRVIRAVLRLSMGAALGTASVGQAIAKDAEAGPLYKALGAPDRLTIKLTLRSRVEAIDGQFRPPPRPADDRLWSLRTTLFAEYKQGPLRIGGEVIDARGYGENVKSSVGTGEVDAVELAQGYVALDVNNRFGKGSTAALTAGRFALNIGSSRLVGRTDFPNTVNSFTGLNFEWSGAGKDHFIGFWTMPALKGPVDDRGVHHNAVNWDRESPELQFYGASFTKAKITSSVSAEVYGYRLAERDSASIATRNRRLSTVGTRLLRSSGKRIDFEAEGAYQFGKIRATVAASDHADLKVSAYFAHAEIGKELALPWAPRLSLHGDIASGDSGTPGHYGRFDSLFGARRTDFGPTALYGPIGRANLVSPGVRIEVKPWPKLDGFVMARGLWLEHTADSFSSTGVRDRSGRSGSYAGAQFEGRVRYWVIPKEVRVELGSAYLVKALFLQAAPNAPATGNTRYVYFDVSGQF